MDYIKKRNNNKKPSSLLSEILTSKQRQLSPRKAFPAPARTSRSPGASASQRLPRRRPAPGSLSPAFTDSFPEKLLQFLLKPFFPSQTQPCDGGLRQGGRPRPASLQNPVTRPSVSRKTRSPGSLGGLGGRVPPSQPGGVPGLSPDRLFPESLLCPAHWIQTCFHFLFNFCGQHLNPCLRRA